MHMFANVWTLDMDNNWLYGLVMIKTLRLVLYPTSRTTTQLCYKTIYDLYKKPKLTSNKFCLPWWMARPLDMVENSIGGTNPVQGLISLKPQTLFGKNNFVLIHLLWLSFDKPVEILGREDLQGVTSCHSLDPSFPSQAFLFPLPLLSKPLMMMLRTMLMLISPHPLHRRVLLWFVVPWFLACSASNAKN